MRNKPAGDASTGGPEKAPTFSGPRVGWLTGMDEQGQLLADFAGNPSAPVPVRSLIPLEARDVDVAIAQRRGAVLLFEDCDPSRPLLMGLMQPTPQLPLLEELLGTPPPAPMEARVDGKRVVLEGKDEIVLKCGEATITLRRNGKIIIRGAQVETHAAGTNRIKGASVKVN